MIEYAARLLRLADELEEGSDVDSRASLLRYGVEAVLTLAGAMDRESSMAGHEGPSSAEADELRHEGDKVIRFACALGFDAVDEVGGLLSCWYAVYGKTSVCTVRAFANLPMYFRL